MTIRGKHNSGSIINVFINMLQCVTIIIFFLFSPPPPQNAVSLAFLIYLLESIRSRVNAAFKSQAWGRWTVPNHCWQTLPKCSLHSAFLHYNSPEKALASVLSRNPVYMLKLIIRSTVPNVGQWAYVNFHCAGICSWEAKGRSIQKAFNA